MSRPALLALAVLVLGAPLPAATETVFHVAPSPAGDDAHDGSATAPFASIDRARRAVRARLTAPGPRGDLVVEIGAGTYELAAPLRFTSEDSGRDGQAVVYRAAPGAAVVLSGGRRITGWTVEGPGVASAAVGRDVDFRQLWVDDRRAIRARTPNAGRMLKLASEKQADGFDLPRECLAGITVRPNELELSVLIAWMHKRLRIARVTAGGQPDTLRAVIAEPEWDAVTKQPQGDRVYLGRSYWLENAPEFLDAPGEFHLDRSRGVLRYLPRPGEDPVRATVVRPALESLVVLDGRPEAPVRNLRFEELTFAYTGWTRPDRAGFVDVQANSLVPADPAAAVDARYRHNQRKDRVPAAFQAFTADRITIRGCRFQHLGGTGVMFTHGGDDNVIEGNSFFDLAAGGIELGEDAVRPDSPRLFPRRNRIANNFLTQIGEDYFGSVAILGYYTEASVIAHNEIVAVPYTGISQGWGWGNPPAPAESRANRITHNLVANYMRRLDDGGGIYTTDALPGSEIAHNVVVHMRPPDPDTKAGGALYLDQFTSGVHVHDNVVRDAIRWLFIWNPNIRGNRVEANYADTPAWRNDGADNFVEPALSLDSPAATAKAGALAAAAGIEPALAAARNFTAATDLVLDTTSMAFQALRGPWTAAEPAARYAPSILASPAPGAAARWLPALPRRGRYEVSVWWHAGSAAGSARITHAQGESIVPIAGEFATGWIVLGQFPFEAGAGAQLELTRGPDPTPEPLRLDSVRFRLVSEPSAP